MPKCRWSHCHHKGEEVSKEDAVLVGKSAYYHPDCYVEKKAIEGIVNAYVEHYDPNPIFPQLRAVINDIVFKKGVPATYVLYCIAYAIEHHIPLRSPMGIHYLTKSYEIKEAWDKKQKAKAAAEVKNTSFDVADGYTQEQGYNYQTKAKGFSSILGSAT